MKKIKLLTFISIVFVFCSCDDLIEPAIENNRGLKDMYAEAEYAQGILLNAYTRLPGNSWSFNDVATDDAVTNDINSNYLKVATGQWTANFNPLDQWTNSKSAIQYLNIFLAEADKVKWAKDDNVSVLFRNRLKGEAYGLRALYMYYLLQAHAGVASNGELLGVPVLLEPQTSTSNFNVGRSSFEDCMKQLYADVAKAVELLPLDFEDAATLPPGYDNLADYNRVFGQYARQRMSSRIAQVVRAQAALLAASPAFSSGSTTAWESAAKYAGELLNLNGGIAGIDPNGLNWYNNAAELSSLGGGVNPKEVIWRSDIAESNALESDNFPPTLFGKGRVNPTQNLVDAFPMANGYPIANPASNYNAANPYANRDPRLQKFILVNQATAGVNNTVITTASDGSTNDALNKVGTSTRTGYYMKKLLRQDVNLNPNAVNNQRHYKPRMRYTELYLIYAEAANEAWGPLASGSAGFSAYDVIQALRKRAGISQPDLYLESIKSDQSAMRNLIRNERRLELCFEGFRFWDLRRWNLNLTSAAEGMKIQGGAYQKITVENRLFQEYMNYGPIPYSEVLKFNALIQNKGW
ncbi:RagB/SusD family nutrient uptake outer membrane protein [Flavobacterium nitrogenifigens]|uniref:Starch-binding associating with outer membrane n=1 Tax=Flavobacterium nitrogenifigens TaxID=1617283 RepID=A0A521FC18_9FLAO|nr:RagB/SusD family nutrient uptake outer membrane protein [Flavobacterium nitrogenifigens]KAF2338684.1 RagB/SusD family nutrient uptake outer membrane protein [Flavobacterium nitrogenifigens]SMO93703.1 Starch-binding associating with outer membrane [Flavobacterium nitrogenifigens]